MSDKSLDTLENVSELVRHPIYNNKICLQNNIRIREYKRIFSEFENSIIYQKNIRTRYVFFLNLCMLNLCQKSYIKFSRFFNHK